MDSDSYGHIGRKHPVVDHDGAAQAVVGAAKCGRHIRRHPHMAWVES